MSDKFQPGDKVYVTDVTSEHHNRVLTIKTLWHNAGGFEWYDFEERQGRYAVEQQDLAKVPESLVVEFKDGDEAVHDPGVCVNEEPHKLVVDRVGFFPGDTLRTPAIRYYFADGTFLRADSVSKPEPVKFEIGDVVRLNAPIFEKYTEQKRIRIVSEIDPHGKTLGGNTYGFTSGGWDRVGNLEFVARPKFKIGDEVSVIPGAHWTISDVTYNPESDEEDRITYHGGELQWGIERLVKKYEEPAVQPETKFKAGDRVRYNNKAKNFGSADRVRTIAGVRPETYRKDSIAYNYVGGGWDWESSLELADETSAIVKSRTPGDWAVKSEERFKPGDVVTYISDSSLHGKQFTIVERTEIDWDSNRESYKFSNGAWDFSDRLELVSSADDKFKPGDRVSYNSKANSYIPGHNPTFTIKGRKHSFWTAKNECYEYVEGGWDEAAILDLVTEPAKENSVSTEFKVGDIVSVQGTVSFVSESQPSVDVKFDGVSIPRKFPNEALTLVERPKVIEPKLPGEIWTNNFNMKFIILGDGKYFHVENRAIAVLPEDTSHWKRFQ